MMLRGVRIVEIEGLGPGPFTGMLLADLGADVIVVHRKGAAGPPVLSEKPLLDRGKRSLSLDLKNADDVSVLKKLLTTADALIEGFRPGVMERLGLGPDDCLSVNPALVYGRMTGWGQNGPLSHTAGHDLNYISMSGAAWFAGNSGEAPFPPPTMVGDIGGGALYLAIGLLSGIMNARSSGQGTVVDAAIYDGSAHMMNLLMAMKQAGNLPNARGKSLLDGSHWARCYQTADGGHVSVQCLEPQFYAEFLSLLGLTDDPTFQEQYNPVEWPELTERLAEIFISRTRDEWAALFDGTDSCVASVLSPEEALVHPVNSARGTWHEIDGVLQAAPAPRFSTAPAWTPSPIPKRGEHDQEILAELAKR